jgi:AcrR family transcriptional regulator
MVMNILHRKEQLILTAIDIIDELGIQKLTTREIAKRQDVSEATLFRHFKNKNELLVAVLDYFVQFDSDILQSARMNNLRPGDALLFLIKSFAEYYENYPAIATLMQIFDVLRYEEDLSDKVKQIQEERTMALQHLIEDAIAAGEFRADLNSRNIAIMISGFFKESCFHWKLSEASYSLKEQVISTLELLLTSLREKTERE